MKRTSYITRAIRDTISVKDRIVRNRGIIRSIGDVAGAIAASFKNGGKLLLCGNGGSAADAQHLAAEFSGKFFFDREPLFAEALHVNTSYLTAVANDYSYDEIFARLVRAKGRAGDVLIGISTSGNSRNVIRAIEAARGLNMVTVGLTGDEGGKMRDICTYMLRVPSASTPRIQEAHILIGHIICEIVEREVFCD